MSGLWFGRLEDTGIRGVEVWCGFCACCWVWWWMGCWRWIGEGAIVGLALVWGRFLGGITPVKVEF